MSGVEPELYDWDVVDYGGKHYVCLWCPNNPRFSCLEDLREHWRTFGRLKWDHQRFYKMIQGRKQWDQNSKKKRGPPLKPEKKDPTVGTKLALFKDKPDGL